MSDIEDSHRGTEDQNDTEDPRSDIEDITEPVPCIVCGIQLDRVFKSEEFTAHNFNQPYRGTTFKTHGHYGSTVYDEMHGAYIEIIVCDDCLEKAGQQGRVVERDFITDYKEVLRKKWDIVARRKDEEEYWASGEGKAILEESEKRRAEFEQWKASRSSNEEAIKRDREARPESHDGSSGIDEDF